MTTTTIKISQLPDLTPFSASGRIPISSGGTTYSVTGQTLTDYVTNSIASGPLSVNTATVGVGGLTVNGPVQFNAGFNFIGTATVITSNSGTFYGDVNGVGALYAGVAGFSPLPSTVIQSSANINGYIQNNFQNINNGTQASTEWVATANNGDDSNHYLDLGIASGTWDGSQSNSVGTAALANDSWVYAQGSTSTTAGGNLILGTIKNGKSVKILAGSTGSSSIVATFNGSGLTLNTGTIRFVDGTSQSTAAVTFNTSTLVRAAVSATNWSGGTVSAESTFSNNLTVGGTLTRSGSVSASAWSINGVGLKLPAATYTDISSTGAVNYNYVNVIGIPTLAASSATTFSTAINLYIGGDPISGANAAVTTGYGLWNAGKTFFQNQVRFNSFLQSGGGATMFSFSNSAASMPQPTASTSTTTGALIVSGGVGIAKSVYVGEYVVQQSLPAFRVYGAGTTTNLSTGTTLTNANFAVDYNQGNYLTTSTGVFTAPVAGLYQINLVGRSYSNTGIASQLAVVKNPSGASTVQCMVEWAANTGVNHMGASTVAKLAVGDQLVAKVLLGYVNFDSNDNWSVAFLG